MTDTRKVVVRHLHETLGTLQLPAGVTVKVESGCVSQWDAPGVCYVNGGNCVGDTSGVLDTKLCELAPGYAEDLARVVKDQGDTARDGTRHLTLFSALLCRSSNSRWVVHAPCVYLHGQHSARGTRNAFHSTHTALSMLIHANRAGMKINKVIMTGMCTGHGRMNRREAALQMTDAFRLALINKRLVTDPGQAKHPRLLLNPQYSIQTRCEDHTPFQPLVTYINADGTKEARVPSVIKTFRSGGSEDNYFI